MDLAAPREKGGSGAARSIPFLLRWGCRWGLTTPWGLSPAAPAGREKRPAGDGNVEERGDHVHGEARRVRRRRLAGDRWLDADGLSQAPRSSGRGGCDPRPKGTGGGWCSCFPRPRLRGSARNPCPAGLVHA